MSWRAPWNSKDKAGGTELVSKKEEEGAWGVHRPQCKESVRNCLFFFFWGGAAILSPITASPRAAVHPPPIFTSPHRSPPPRTHTRTNERNERNNATKHHCPTAYADFVHPGFPRFPFRRYPSSPPPLPPVLESWLGYMSVSLLPPPSCLLVLVPLSASPLAPLRETTERTNQPSPANLSTFHLQV